MSHIELEWQVPAIRDWYESLSRRFQVVRFDFRSCGLSGVVQESLGIDAYVRDLEAVVRAIEVDRLAIFANAFACAVAIRFTAAHPDEVLRLALFSPWLRMPKWIRSSLVAGPLMMETGLDFWARSNANARSGQRDSEGHYARVFRNAISPELQPRLAKAYMAMDVRDDAANIRSPTIVATNHYLRASTDAREVAAAIPAAQLTVFDESEAVDPYFIDQKRVLDALVPFLSEGFPDDAPVDAPAAVDAAAAPAATGLTKREIEVIRHVAQGLSNDAIGEQLVISSATVARHVSNILNKTGLTNRTELARYASENGLL